MWPAQTLFSLRKAIKTIRFLLIITTIKLSGDKFLQPEGEAALLAESGTEKCAATVVVERLTHAFLTPVVAESRAYAFLAVSRIDHYSSNATVVKMDDPW